ncbi:hypothetical protein KIW84_064798 [Lathyrus oleraceus]|uniref:Uncharacterized protein n=1 Tax=Pisum sativum TaxID=3888 RepID=A0A9D5A6M4_PEA|nr:hypothetical protein KIW84_064798 [Pisum sativum]
MLLLLKGTVFLKYWFEILDARIGSSVLLDTFDITDPSLVSIRDEAVISEGVLVQSHEVKNGILSLHPIRIGWNSSIGPYAVIQKGSVVKEGAEIQPLQKVEGDQHVLKPTKLNNVKEDWLQIPSDGHAAMTDAQPCPLNFEEAIKYVGEVAESVKTLRHTAPP